ncbi:MAG: twin-arginine translocase subunit TatC, partial [Syntrophales bacterium]|nr:twin-arginine translocase subunit TatC [Syntrophales bacterium]
MPFTAHLQELRFRLIRIIAAVGIGFVVCYTFKDWLFKVITKPLSNVL